MTKNNIEITLGTKGIKINGHRGTWYVLASSKAVSPEKVLKTLFLLEHEQYGDEVAGLIVDKYGNIILDDVWNGFSDLEEEEWIFIVKEEN